jgi:hypothetical protein
VGLARDKIADMLAIEDTYTMEHIPTRTVFDAVTDFLATEPSPQEIVDYFLPEDLQARLDHLLDKNGEDELNYAEQAELETFLNTDELFSMLKTKMKIKLKQQHESD